MAVNQIWSFEESSTDTNSLTKTERKSKDISWQQDIHWEYMKQDHTYPNQTVSQEKMILTLTFFAYLGYILFHLPSVSNFINKYIMCANDGN